MVDTLATFFTDEMKKARSLSKVETVITEKNVFQEGDSNILPILDGMVEKLILPGSNLFGMENLEELYAKAESGKSCLLLVEHYSNLDLSIVSLFARKAGGRGKEISDSIIAIAGMKLNEDNPIVAAFASAYSRIVIYPSRALHEQPEEVKRRELPRSNSINRAAMKALNEQKVKGKLILVFPSGTRYRPWAPETKKGVREIDSYIRSFDYMCFVALNGTLLQVQQTDMINDIVNKDIVTVTVGKVFSCADFREKIKTNIEQEEDKKQAVADAIMNELEKMHVAAEAERKKL